MGFSLYVCENEESAIFEASPLVSGESDLEHSVPIFMLTPLNHWFSMCGLQTTSSCLTGALARAYPLVD